MEGILIPENLIYNTLNGFLTHIRSDYQAKADKTQTFLYRMFRENSLDSYRHFDQVANLIVTTPNNPKHLKVYLGYMRDRVDFPSVHISMPSEQPASSNTMGMGITEDDYDFDAAGDTVSYNLKRAYDTQYHVVIMSENRAETVLMYHMFKAVLTAATHHLSFYGIRNLKLGGTDLSHDARIPDGIYGRAVTLSFDYETSTPDWMVTQLIGNINLTATLSVNY